MRAFHEDNDHHRSFRASLKCSKWFTENLFQTVTLTINNRVLPGQETFLRWLKALGCGIGITSPDTQFEERIQIPDDMKANSIEKLLEFVFPKDLFKNIRYHKIFIESIYMNLLQCKSQCYQKQCYFGHYQSRCCEN
jgi:hypothetical protein